MVMSLEEKGPAVAAPAVLGAGSGATTPGKQQQQQQKQLDSGQSPAAADAAAHLPDQGRVPQHQPQSILQPAAGAAAPEGAAAAGSQGFRQMREYLVAWELEVWRKVGRQRRDGPRATRLELHCASHVSYKYSTMQCVQSCHNPNSDRAGSSLHAVPCMLHASEQYTGLL